MEALILVVAFLAAAYIRRLEKELEVKTSVLNENIRLLANMSHTHLPVAGPGSVVAEPKPALTSEPESGPFPSNGYESRGYA
jgi:hypothetical protein